MPASRTRTSAHPGRNFGTGFEIALNFLFTVRKESTGRSSSFSSYLYGIAILPAKPSCPVPPFSPSDRTWPPAAPAGGRRPCSHLRDVSLVPSAPPCALRSARSSGWLQPHPAVSQNAIDVGDGFVQILDHSVRGMSCRLCQAAQFRFILNWHVQLHIHRGADFLREGFSAQLRTPSAALLLYLIHMNQRCRPPDGIF